MYFIIYGADLAFNAHTKQNLFQNQPAIQRAIPDTTSALLSLRQALNVEHEAKLREVIALERTRAQQEKERDLAALRRQLQQLQQQATQQAEQHRRVLSEKDAECGRRLATAEEAHVRAMEAKQAELDAKTNEREEIFEALEGCIADYARSEEQYHETLAEKEDELATLSTGKERLEAQLQAKTDEISGLQNTLRLAHQDKATADRQAQDVRIQMTQTQKTLAQQEQDRQRIANALSAQTKESEKLNKDFTTKLAKQEGITRALEAQNKQYRLEQERYKKHIQELTASLQEQRVMLRAEQQKTLASEQEQRRLHLEQWQLTQHDHDDKPEDVRHKAPSILSITDDQDTLSRASSFSFVENI